MRLDRVDRWLGPCLLVLAIVWLWLVFAFIPGARGEGEPGPRAFPVLLGIVLVLLGGFVTASAFLPSASSTADETGRATRREVLIAAATFGLLMLYAFLLEKLGFLIATPVVVVLAMAGILRMRNWLLVAALAGGLTAACWMFFVWLLKAPLPRGLWLM
ncbi:MAG: tripartite tricarboxylate transporter TctB family protein [Betaproteobacteria bacterium]|nr:tripartite tricarboxylate transporter TctB family protein [Betaproteobacteria bacterium]